MCREGVQEPGVCMAHGAGPPTPTHLISLFFLSSCSRAPCSCCCVAANSAWHASRLASTSRCPADTATCSRWPDSYWDSKLATRSCRKAGVQAG